MWPVMEITVILNDGSVRIKKIRRDLIHVPEFPEMK
jgi:hypothetical protein